MSLTSNLMMHSDIVAPYILHLGSEEQKKKYLPKMISGECFGALAMTEPGTGSDLQAIKTNAQPDGDGYRLNGSKTFITNRSEEHTSELPSIMRISNAASV